MEFFGFAVLVVGLAAITVLRRHLRESKQLELRQILHEERLKAMEHSLPLPDSHDEHLSSLLAEPGRFEGGSSRGLHGAVLWVRLVTLCIGLTLFLGGVGTALAMARLTDDEVRGMWSIGLIPVFVGFGLLIFYRMSRSFAGSAGVECED
jgi:hypothetical protein